MTILKVTNYYLSLPQDKGSNAKDAFENSLETYIRDIMDMDVGFDLDLFIENLEYDYDNIELLDGSNIKDDDVYYEYSEEELEEIIQEILDSEQEEEDDEEYQSDEDEDEEDY